MAKLGTVIVAIVLVSATIRLRSVLNPPVTRSADVRGLAKQVRLRLIDRSPSPDFVAEFGISQVEFQRFDPDAVVLMRPGPDMQPGIAALDDNANGIVDDPAELGATGSDDVCLVRRAGDGDPSDLDPSNLDPSDGQTKLVLQHGAFVPATPSEPQKLSSQWRALVKGQSDGDHWSFLVEME